MGKIFLNFEIIQNLHVIFFDRMIVEKDSSLEQMKKLHMQISNKK